MDSLLLSHADYCVPMSALLFIFLAPAFAAARQMVIPGWARFTQMTSLLELGLEDIVSCWRANQIVFTADELKSVIKALFQNTALRASCLAQLK